MSLLECLRIDNHPSVTLAFFNIFSYWKRSQRSNFHSPHFFMVHNKTMDAGLMTSESSSIPNAKDGMCITCRICRQQIPLDDLGDHQCVSTASIGSQRKLIKPEHSAESQSEGPEDRSSGSSTSLYMDNQDRRTLKNNHQNSPQRYSNQDPSPTNSPVHYRKSHFSSTGAPLPTLPRKLSLKDTVSAMMQRSTLTTTTNKYARMKTAIHSFRVTTRGYVTYVITTILSSNQMEYHTERRYSDFFSFAQMVDSIFPKNHLMKSMPPKTCCGVRNTSVGFLERRKLGLDSYLSDALTIIQNEDLKTKPTLGQLYVLREFLDVPSPLDMNTAFDEFRRHALDVDGWKLAFTPVKCKDKTFEKTIDGFGCIKRVAFCPYPARAVFDMIITPFDNPLIKQLRPWLIQGEILNRRSEQMWTEHIFVKTTWLLGCREMVNRINWRVDQDGSIIIVIVAGDLSDWPEPNMAFEKADCILGGWMIKPTSPNQLSCEVTYFMQANFFGSHVSGKATSTRSLLLGRSEELSHILGALKQNYNKNHYSDLGAMLSPRQFSSVTVLDSDMKSLDINSDPKIYTLVKQFEPNNILMVQKNTNKNVLIFSPNFKYDGELHEKEPLNASWIMFEKLGNPRSKLSPIEKNTVYEVNVKRVGPCSYLISMSFLKNQDMLLALGQDGRPRLSTTVSGIPQVCVKRIKISFSNSSFSFKNTIQEVELFGEDTSGCRVYEKKKF